MGKQKIGLMIGVALAMGVAACTTSPTSGERIFTGFVSSQQESQIGMENHADLLKQFNGVADNKKADAMVQRIAARLAPHAERKDVQWTFTVLNDDLVNAFAVPGGYIYITRGLLNLAQNEAQVAAVLGHEMGHINARHSAQQMSQGMIANLGLSALGIALGSDVANQAGSIGADLFIKSYSRAHEMEADALAIRYLSAAGYDPYANADFLYMLELHSQLQARMAGSEAGDQLASFFSTHPATPERVTAARQLAAQMPKKANPIINRAEYLQAIDGTVYGDSAEQGFIRGQEFIHPELKIRFSVPSGFVLKNSPQQVLAQHKSGAAIIFDMGQGKSNDPVEYISSIWAQGANLTQQEKITVNGMAAATAATQMTSSKTGIMETRILAVSAGNNRFYRMIFMTPRGAMNVYADGFKRSTYSLKQLSAQELQRLSPNRVRLIKVKSGDTVQSLAAQMPVTDFAVERFCLLNGITPETKLQNGATIKTIAPF